MAKVVHGLRVVAALVERGLIPADTTRVTIRATVGDLVQLEYDFEQGFGTRTVLLHGHKFVVALVEAGLLPDETRSVLIDVKANGVAMLTYETFATDDLLAVVPGLFPAETEREAVCR